MINQVGVIYPKSKLKDAKTIMPQIFLTIQFLQIKEAEKNYSDQIVRMLDYSHMLKGIALATKNNNIAGLDEGMLTSMQLAVRADIVLDDPMLEAMSSALEEDMFLDDAFLNGINLAVKANINLDKALLKTIGAASVEEDSPLLNAIQYATQHNIEATKSLINEMVLALKYNINLGSVILSV
ncbi:MAG: hypothetical protein GY821_08790 [Gammaproteobacteria bacterium]|nr:hypothetical protein [Gammaproteobacteria bacterium]